LWLQTIEIPEPKALLADVFDPAGFERLADKMRICNKTEPLEQVQKEIPSAFASEIFKPDFTKVSSQIPNRAACAYLRMPQPGIAVNSGRRPGSRPGVGSGSKRTDDAPRVTNDVNEIGVWNKFKNERGIGHMLWCLLQNHSCDLIGGSNLAKNSIREFAAEVVELLLGEQGCQSHLRLAGLGLLPGSIEVR